LHLKIELKWAAQGTPQGEFVYAFKIYVLKYLSLVLLSNPLACEFLEIINVEKNAKVQKLNMPSVYVYFINYW